MWLQQETLESLIESEKTFDQQFKSWEASFLQWKEQNVNHPDKVELFVKFKLVFGN